MPGGGSPWRALFPAVTFPGRRARPDSPELGQHQLAVPKPAGCPAMAWDSQGHPGASSKGVSRAGPSWGIPRRRLGRAHPRPPELRASLPQDLLPGPGEPSAPGDAAQRHPVRRARATPGRLLRRQQAAAGPRGPGLGHHPALQLQAVRGVCQRPGHGEGLGWHPWGVQEGLQHLGVPSAVRSPVPQFSSGSGATLVPQQSGPPSATLCPPPGS